MREIGLGAVPVPVVLHLHAAQRRPCLGQPLVEGDRPLGMPARHRHRLVDLQGPQHRGRRHQQIGRGEARMRHGVVGIERQRLLEQGQGLDQRQPREGLEMGPRLELQEVGLGRPRAIAVHAPGRGGRLRQRASRRARRSRPAAPAPSVWGCSKRSLHSVRPLATSIRRAETRRRSALRWTVPSSRCSTPSERAPARSLDGLDRRDGEARHAAQRRAHGVGDSDAEIAVGLGEVAGREGPHRKGPGGGVGRRTARPAGLRQDPNRRGQAIARPRHRLDHVGGRAQRLAQGRHMDGERAVLDHDVGPQPRRGRSRAAPGGRRPRPASAGSARPCRERPAAGRRASGGARGDRG